MADRLLYSQTEAAVMLNTSTRRLAWLAEHGHIRYILDGKRRKFLLSDIDAYMQARRPETWDCTAAPTQSSGGTRSQSKVVEFAVVAGRRRVPTPSM